MTAVLLQVATGFEAQKRGMPPAYTDTVLLAEIGMRAYQSLEALPAGCRHGCGFTGTGVALSTHERREHSRCHQCGQDPHGVAPVAHLSDCRRAAVDAMYARDPQTGGRL